MATTFLDEKALANLLNWVFFRKSFQIKSLQSEVIFPYRQGFESLFALLLQFENYLSTNKLRQNILDQGKKNHLESLHLFYLLLLEIR